MRIIIFPSLLVTYMVFASPLYAQSLNNGLFNSGILTIDSGAVLSITDTFLNNVTGVLINKGTINAGRAFVNNGAINGKGKVVLNGTSLQNISGTGGIINNLEINSAGVTISPGNTQSITGTLLLTAGTLTTNTGLTLKSTDSITARVALVRGGSVIGNLIVERYIPARRAWRLVTTPLSNTNTIYQAWQAGGAVSPGIGTFITGPTGGNGLDDSRNYLLPASPYSLKTYDIATQLFVPVTNTFSTALSGSSASAANKGYFIFTSGDRTSTNFTPPNSNNTTLKTTGALQTGAQTFAASGTANNFTLIGNPYASPVDFDKLSRTLVAKRFYTWDPALNSVGGFVLVDDYDGDGIYDVIPSTMQTKVLQSGQAFFVQTLSSGAAAVAFNENSKSDFTANTGFRTTNGSNEALRINLYLKNTDTTSILADGVLAEFNNNYSAAVNIEDGIKMENINENLAIERDARLLAFERRPFANVNDTLFLNLKNTTSNNYRFRFEPSNLSSIASASLEDSYLNTGSSISVTAPTVVDFNVVANTGSAAANRFRVVFKISGTLPINFTTVKAHQQNAGIEVGWNLAIESNMSQYEVEKSANGYEFKKVGTTAATHNNNAAAGYNWFDANPYNGNNFYRIKAVEKTSNIKYSSVVNLKMGNGKQAIVIYPNPIIDKTLNLHFINQPKGIYSLRLINQSGQVILIKQIPHSDGSSTEAIELNSSLKKGQYVLEVTAPDKSRKSFKLSY